MRILSLLFSALLLAVSCSQEGRGYDDPTGSDYVSFRSNSITRMAESSWQDGDKVGLFVGDDAAVYQNLMYNIAVPSDAMTPQNESDRVFISSSARNCYAYYPYATTASGGEYKVDISDQSSLPAIDLLWSGKVESPAQSELVGFTFSHQLARIKIDLTIVNDGDGIISEENTVVEMIEGYATAKFDLKSGEFSDKGVATTKLDVTPSADGTSATITAIVIPQSDLTAIKFYITYKGILYTYGVKEAEDGWKSGKSYDYKIVADKDADPSSTLQRVAATRVSEINNY